jgi:hypothetical protein
MLKIEAVESGRLVPVPRAWSFESSRAAAGDEAGLISLIESCDFFHVAEPGPVPGADRGSLTVSVELDGHSRQLTIPCGSAPPGLEPLVAFIESRLQWRPRDRRP